MHINSSTAGPRIMGVINVTPDSFSGDGLLAGENFIDAACAQAERMVAEGAHILDIGGESSRPGHTPVTAEEEIRRVAPVITGIRDRFPAIPLAVDTVKSSVADAALKAGATMVNDVSALTGDAQMAHIVARHGCDVVLMDNRSDPESFDLDPRLGGQYAAPENADIVADVRKYLAGRVEFAVGCGVAPRKIILDPGIGFGKTVAQNLALIARLGIIKSLGFPVLIAPSRKSFVGRILDTPTEERLEGTAAAISVAAFLGADIVRVHDVKFMARAAKMAAALADAL